MKKIKLLALAWVGILIHQAAFAQVGELSGKVTDAKTGEPLIGASVQLQDTEMGAITDVNGSYLIKEIPAKTYSVKASFLGYDQQIKYNVVIRSEGNIDVNFQMDESSQELEGVTVVANPFVKEAETPLSIQKLSQEEVASYPGGNNDIAKVVQSLPGISGSIGGFRNDVIIRGGAPNENVYYLDGVEIPNINHFATQGSAGGPVGLLNVSFFEGVSLTSSSFGAQYDNALSGVLQFDQRRGNARNFNANFRLGASEAAVTVEGPLFKGEREQSKTAFIASVRRSYLQFLFEVIGLPFLPDYWDYQYKLSHQLDEYNELILTGVGSIDDFKINPLEEYDEEQQAIQDQIPIIKQSTSSGGVTWKRRFKDNSGFMQTTASINVLNNTFSQYQDNVNQVGLFFRNRSTEQEAKLRYKYTKFLGKWTISAGGVFQNADYSNETENLVNGLNYGTSINFFRYGAFAQASANLANERVGLSFGLRTDGNDFTVTGNEMHRTISPRAAISYQLSPNGKWSATASVGRYFKISPYTILGVQDNTGSFINQDAEYIRSDHVVAGLEYLVSPTSRLSVEGFYKLYNHYPVSLEDSVSLANKGGGFEVFGNESVASVGKGRTYGMECLYQQKFNGKYYAIVAYTLYWSEFTGFDQSNYLPSTWDSRHLVSITGGYKFGRNWELSTRYRFAANTPYPPVDEEATLVVYPAIIRDFSRLGEEKLAPLSQLDVRIDKKWSFKRFSLDLFIDVQNVLMQTPPNEPRFGLLRTDEGQPIMPNQLTVIQSEDGGSVLPTIGLVINI